MQYFDEMRSSFAAYIHVNIIHSIEPPLNMLLHFTLRFQRRNSATATMLIAGLVENAIFR